MQAILDSSLLQNFEHSIQPPTSYQSNSYEGLRHYPPDISDNRPPPITDDRLICILSPLGTVLYVSPSASSLLGAYPNTIAGSSIMDHVHPDDLDQFISSMSAIISNGTSLQMMYRLKFHNQYRLYQGFGRPSNEDIDGYQGMGQGMVLVSKLAESPSPSSSDSIWSRRQASRMQKGLVLNQAPAKLEYEINTLSNSSTSTPSSAVTSSIISSVYDHSPLSAATTYSTVSPFEEDLSNSSSSSLLRSLNPPSATPSLVSFEDSSNWTATSTVPYHPYSGMKSYSYFDSNEPQSLEELTSPRAAPNDYPKDDSVINPITNYNPNVENSYWDNVSNSELVSPFFVPTTMHSLPKSSSYFVDPAAQARSKSYSLPGLFDVNAQVRYQPYQPTTTTGSNQSIDFSGYSMSVKKSPVDAFTTPSTRKSMSMNKQLKHNKSSANLPITPSTITKTRRKSKQNNRDEMMSYVCTECGVKESPEWRKGPKGPKTLCNACGLRWAKWTRQKSSNDDSK